MLKLAKNAKVKSIAELYHIQQSVVRLFRYAFAAKRKSLKAEEKKIQKNIIKLIESQAETKLIEECQEELKVIENKNTILRSGQSVYRQQLKDISTIVHPFGHSSQLKTSTTLADQLNSSLAGFVKT